METTKTVRFIPVGVSPRASGKYAVVVDGDLFYNMTYVNRSFALKKALAFAKKIYGGWTGATTYIYAGDVTFPYEGGGRK